MNSTRSVQPFGLRAFPRIGDLLAGDIVGRHGHAVVLRHVQRQRSPAAAGFEHFLAGLQPQFAAYVIQLGELRLFQAAVRVGK